AGQRHAGGGSDGEGLVAGGVGTDGSRREADAEGAGGARFEAADQEGGDDQHTDEPGSGTGRHGNGAGVDELQVGDGTVVEVDACAIHVAGEEVTVGDGTAVGGK